MRRRPRSQGQWRGTDIIFPASSRRAGPVGQPAWESPEKQYLGDSQCAPRVIRMEDSRMDKVADDTWWLQA